jgi:hypothetical protein
MSTLPRLLKKKAHQIPSGTTVLHVVDGDTVLGLKAEREGKEYVHHYMVPLDPHPAQDMRLVYLDPEDDLIACGGAAVFALAEGVEPAGWADVGHIFQNSEGIFLKVIEDPKSLKMYAFVDIRTGEIRRRQERGVNTVFMQWRAEGMDGGDARTVTFAQLREAYSADQ